LQRSTASYTSKRVMRIRRRLCLGPGKRAARERQKTSRGASGGLWGGGGGVGGWGGGGGVGGGWGGGVAPCRSLARGHMKKGKI